MCHLCSLQVCAIDFDTPMGFMLGAGRSKALTLQVGESSNGTEMSADSALFGYQGLSHPVEDPWSGFAWVDRWELVPS